VSTELESRFQEVVRDFTPALWRLGRGYEHDPDKRRDLHQEILVSIWRALPGFEGRSSLRTFVLRVAHNTACGHVTRARRRGGEMLSSLEDLDVADVVASAPTADESVDAGRAVERLAALVRSLAPIDRQLILLHLEGLDPTAIAEVTGLSTTNVTTKVHRIKALLAKRFGLE
jgi:RNA polymerase sigma-70 factor (ECF subfamily)